MQFVLSEAEFSPFVLSAVIVSFETRDVQKVALCGLGEKISLYKLLYVSSVSPSYIIIKKGKSKKKSKNTLCKCASCYGNHMPEAITILV